MSLKSLAVLSPLMGLLVMFYFVAARFDHRAAKLGRSEAATGSASGHASNGSIHSLQLARGNEPVMTFFVRSRPKTTQR